MKIVTNPRFYTRSTKSQEEGVGGESRGYQAAATGKFSATVVVARARATQAFGPINSCDRTKGSLQIPAASGAAHYCGSFGIFQRIITGRCSRDTALSLFRGYPCACTLPREPFCAYVYAQERQRRWTPRTVPLPSPSPPTPLVEALIANLTRINLF